MSNLTTRRHRNRAAHRVAVNRYCEATEIACEAAGLAYGPVAAPDGIRLVVEMQEDGTERATRTACLAVSYEVSHHRRAAGFLPGDVRRIVREEGARSRAAQTAMRRRIGMV